MRLQTAMIRILFWLLVTSSVFAMVDEEEQTSAVCQCGSPSALNCSSLNLTALVTLNLCGDRVLTIDASQNQLESLDALDTWTGDVLNVSHNLLAEIGDTASWIAQVKVLDVSWNKFETFNAEAMKNLRELFVNDNPLKTIQLPVNECKLERVNVAANVLTQLPDELKNCPALSNFDASYNKIEYLPEDIMLILDMERMSENLTIDLRENPLPEAVVAPTVRAAVESLGCLQVTPDASDCTCVSFRKQSHREEGVVLTLCISSLCIDETKLWTHCPASVTHAPELEDISTTQHEEITPSRELVPSPAQSPPVMTVATPEVAPYTSTDTISVPESPPLPLLPTPTAPCSEAPPPTPSREERRRRRLALALILTAVALVLGAGLVAALIVLYRRRRREARRETEAARYALKPLVSDTTPRFMRSTDNFTS